MRGERTRGSPGFVVLLIADLSLSFSFTDDPQKSLRDEGLVHGGRMRGERTRGSPGFVVLLIADLSLSFDSFDKVRFIHRVYSLDYILDASVCVPDFLHHQ